MKEEILTITTTITGHDGRTLSTIEVAGVFLTKGNQSELDDYLERIIYGDSTIKAGEQKLRASTL